MSFLQEFKFEKTDSFISEFVDPFNKGAIESVSLHISRNYDKISYRCWGYIEFMQNNTEGKQNFKGDTFDELYKKMEAFIKSLDSEQKI